MSHLIRTLKLATSAFALLSLAACGGSNDGGTQPATPSITLSASPSAITVQRGGTGTIVVNSTRANIPGNVSISVDGLPAGVTATSNPAQLDASTPSAIITVAVASTVPVGNYTATVRASAAGVSATATYALSVVEPPDFSLTAAPDAVTVSSATSGTSAITIARTGGFTGAVTFTMHSAQAGLSGVFTPASTADNSTTLAISATDAVPVGTYPVTIAGNSPMIGDRTTTAIVNVVTAPGFSINAAPTALSIAAGSNATSTVTITRVGGFSGEVTSALTSAQAGISGTFAPPATTGTSTVATVNVAASVPVGTYNATITSSAVDQSDRTATLAITVSAQPTISIALTASALTIANANQGTSTVNITRTNFTGAVTLASTGQPAGMNVTFNPSPTTTNSSVATVNVGPSVTVGSYPLTITASGSGVANVSSTLTVTVPAAMFIEEQFCSTNAPAWFAYQDGEGTWTRVLPTTNGSYTQFRFPIGSAYGAFTVMRGFLNNGVQKYQTSYYYGTREELASLRDSNPCLTSSPTGLSRLITLSGFTPTTHLLFLRVGSLIFLSGPVAPDTYNLLNYPLGTQTIFAFKQLRVSAQPDLQFAERIVIHRDIPQATSALPPVDFDDNMISFAPVAGTITIQNLLGDMASTAAPFTPRGVPTGVSLSNTTPGTATQRTYHTVPAANRVPGDFDEMTVTANEPGDGTTTLSRQTRIIGTTAGQPYIVPLGTKIEPTMLSAVASGGYTRPRLQLSIPAEYDRTVTFNLTTTLSTGFLEGSFNSVTLMGGYRALTLAGPNLDFTLPDISAAAGFPSDAALPRGSCVLGTTLEGWTGGMILDNAPGRVYKSVFTQRTVVF